MTNSEVKEVAAPFTSWPEKTKQGVLFMVTRDFNEPGGFGRYRPKPSDDFILLPLATIAALKEDELLVDRAVAQIKPKKTVQPTVAAQGKGQRLPKLRLNTDLNNYVYSSYSTIPGGTKFDVKNLNIKTDGSPIKYKPEYHSSNMSSNIFPLS